MLHKLLGPAPHAFSESTVRNRVLAAGEGIDILEPRDAAGAGLKPGKPGSEGELFGRSSSRPHDERAALPT